MTKGWRTTEPKRTGTARAEGVALPVKAPLGTLPDPHEKRPASNSVDIDACLTQITVLSQ
jgi:hypothetical protein